MTALRPYTIGAFSPGADAYVQDFSVLPNIPRARWWRYRGVTKTLQLATGEYVKTFASWGDDVDVDTIRAAVEECRARYGISFPSGFAAPFRKLYRAPSIPWTFNAPFARSLAGGWQEAIRRGEHTGTFYRYDIRSAYLWAVTEGLPDPRTFRFTRSLASRDALFRVRLAAPCSGAPYPFNRQTDVIATGAEIGHYGLDVADVVAGVAWRRMIDPDCIYSAVTDASFWKAAGRCYWGTWAQSDPVECYVPGKTWNLPCFGANYVWAHTILSRVRRRLADVVDAGAVHVFTDSVITPARIPTGNGVGEWKLDRTYARGVVVLAAGWYGEPGAALERASGVPLRDIRRMQHLTPVERSSLLN